MGRKTRFGKLKADKISCFQPAADASEILCGSDGTCLAVDFSGASGAEGMLVMAGPSAPSEGRLGVSGRQVSFLSSNLWGGPAQTHQNSNRNDQTAMTNSQPMAASGRQIQHQSAQPTL